jgi:uncharacterized low-complexity protein
MGLYPRRKSMSENKMNPVAVAVGAAVATSLAGISVANAETTPFAMTALSTGYMADVHYGEGKCGEGKCGGEKGEEDKGEEGKCGGDKGEEGKCGGDKGEEGKCGGEKGEEGGDKGEEGKCGEGKCGGSV